MRLAVAVCHWIWINNERFINVLRHRFRTQKFCSWKSNRFVFSRYWVSKRLSDCIWNSFELKLIPILTSWDSRRRYYSTFYVISVVLLSLSLPVCCLLVAVVSHIFLFLSPCLFILWLVVVVVKKLVDDDDDDLVPVPIYLSHPDIITHHHSFSDPPNGCSQHVRRK